MNLHKEWMTNNELFGEDYSKNILLNQAKARFEEQRDDSLEGKTGKIDGVDEDFVVQNHANTLNKYNGDKYIHCAEISNIHRGSVVDYENKKWLVTSDILNNQAYKSGIIQECNQSLTLTLGTTTVTVGYDNLGRPIPKKIASETHTWDCIAETKIFDPDLNKAINLPEGKIYLTVPYSLPYGNLIQENMVFEMWNRNYKITGLDLSKVIDGVGIIGVYAIQVVN